MQTARPGSYTREESVSRKQRNSSASYQRSLKGFGTKPEAMGTFRRQTFPSQRQKSLRRKQPEPLRRAVADCLSTSHNPGFTSEAILVLQDYLASNSSVHSAYSVLLEHAIAERDRSPPVILKCISLLKRYLFRYVPPYSTLQQIDSFCASLIAECTATSSRMVAPWRQSTSPLAHPLTVRSSSAFTPGLTTSVFASEALLKSLTYVRAVVARHLSGFSLHSAGAAGKSLKSYMPALSSTHSRSFSTKYLAKENLARETVEEKGSAESSPVHLVHLEHIGDEHRDYIATNVLDRHWIHRKGKQVWTPSPVMMDSGGIARPQAEHVHCLEKGAACLLLKYGFRDRDFSVNPGEKKLSLEIVSEKLLRPSTMMTITEPAAAKLHLRAVAASKRLKSPYIGWDGDAPGNTVRRRPRPLFQYRYYSEQQPLRLSEMEIEEVIAAVCLVGVSSSSVGLALVPVLPNNQAGNVTIETSDIAASVLIKLLIDMYMADSRTAAPLTLSILEGMLICPVKAVRIRAFDLMLNLGIHAHLLEPSHNEDQEDVHEEAMLKVSENGSVSSSLSDLRIQQGTSRAVTEFEAWLLEVLSDMLLFLVQAEECEEGVWAAALSSLFYLICERGRIRKRCLSGVDIRVLKVLLELSRQNAWAEEIHCMIIQIASNMLFYDMTCEEDSILEAFLDFEKLEMMGGIDTICTEYAAVKSAEAKHNMFVVLFDYVLAQIKHKCSLAGKPHPSEDEIQAVATVLFMAEAPEAVSAALKEGSQVGDALAKSIMKAFTRDIASSRLNVMLLEEITGLLDVLIAKHTSLDEEFQGPASKVSFSDELPVTPAGSMVASTSESSSSAHGWMTLHALLYSSHPHCRSRGYSWLMKLLSSEFERGCSKENGPLGVHLLQSQFDSVEKSSALSDVLESPSPVSPAVTLLCGLLKSPDPSIRQGFLLVLERLLSQYERIGCNSESTTTSLSDFDGTMTRRESSSGEDLANNLVGLMNAALWQVISANDTHHSSIFQMCNLMFSNLCLKWPPPAVKSDYFHKHSNHTGEGLALDSTVGSSALSAIEGGSVRKSWDKSPFTERIASTSKVIKHCAKGSSQFSSVAALLLQDEAAAPKLLVASIPTALLYWPLMQLSGAPTDDVTLGVAVGSRGGGNVPGGVSDVRAALLLLLISKCTVQPGAFEDVGGEEFFRLLLDDCDARVSYYSASFLLKRMMNEEPEKYQRILHNLVFKAQQSNNEKLLENPYLQMRGILQLSSDTNKSQAYPPYDG